MEFTGNTLHSQKLKRTHGKTVGFRQVFHSIKTKKKFKKRMRNVSLEQNSSLDLDIGNVSSIFCRSKLFCQLVQLECLYLDKTSLKLLTLPPHPPTPPTPPPGSAVSTSIASFLHKGREAMTFPHRPVMFVLCIVPYLDLLRLFRVRQVIN